jgi:hypothetical protein
MKRGTNGSHDFSSWAIIGYNIQRIFLERDAQLILELLAENICSVRMFRSTIRMLVLQEQSTKKELGCSH